MRYWRMRGFAVALCAVALVVGLGTTAQATTSTGHAGGSHASRGGSLTVDYTGGVWLTLDPALDTFSGADYDLLDAIYGELFEESTNGTIVPDLATKYAFSDHNLALTIDLRHHVKFTDGTAFNAQAVQYNLERDFLPSNACQCLGNFSVVSSVTVAGPYAVVLHLSKPYAPILDAFVGEAPNWIASPTALQSEPESTFGQHPIGAGPFEVVSDYASSSLSLVRNPDYWEKGHPYLSKLEFVSTSSDQAAYASLEAGSAQLLEEFTTTSLIEQAKSSFHVITAPGSAALAIQFNSYRPPMNNILAREAIIYATNPKQLLAALSPGFGVVTETPSGPGSGIFWEQKVPGYRTYNLAKAKQLVQQLGGLSVTFFTQTTQTALNEGGAVANQWEQAGIKVSYQGLAGPQAIGDIASGTYEMTLTSVGSPDPDLGAEALPDRWSSTGFLSTVKDPTLDGMINQSAAFVSPTTRQRVVFNIYKYIDQHAYGDFMFATPTGVIASRSVGGLTGPAFTSNDIMFQWENIYLK